MLSAAFKRAPFKIAEEGWGEFDMVITLSAIDKGGDFPLMHDLNFQSEHYEAKHSIVGFLDCTAMDSKLILNVLAGLQKPQTRTS